MNLIEHSVNNQGVTIHCLEYHKSTSQTPIVIVPGVTNSAEEIAQDLQRKLNHYHVIISLRGRGKSQAPEVGYSLEDQASDVVAVITHLQISECFLFGYSVGVPIAIKAATQLAPRVKAVILGDYAPFYPSFDKSWAARVKEDDPLISNKLLYGLVADSKFTNLVPDLKSLDIPVLLLKAGQKNSAFPIEAIPKFKESIPKGVVDILSDRDHDIFSPSPNKLIERLNAFITHLETTTT
ncbi:MAG TPA: alpha/beta hydrolase [Chitinophagales bacterium]|nr:alpha/beta hydrolase [Chitinophagales bacterium]HRK29302.1 alpha/beta hydrolase [Chitinophagales bacterium]